MRTAYNVRVRVPKTLLCSDFLRLGGRGQQHVSLNQFVRHLAFKLRSPSLVQPFLAKTNACHGLSCTGKRSQSSASLVPLMVSLGKLLAESESCSSFCKKEGGRVGNEESQRRGGGEGGGGGGGKCQFQFLSCPYVSLHVTACHFCGFRNLPAQA